MKSSSSERAKRASKEGIALVSKRIKAIKLFNKSEFRWQVTVNEYLSDKLASRFKNPGHALEEEKEIAELSKEESTRTVTTISANHYICFNKKKK